MKRWREILEWAFLALMILVLTMMVTSCASWRGAAIATTATDIASTQYGLDNGCSEGNPLYGNSPSMGKMLVINAAVIGTVWYLTKDWPEKEQQKVWKWFTLFRGAATIWNINQARP